MCAGWSPTRTALADLAQGQQTCSQARETQGFLAALFLTHSSASLPICESPPLGALCEVCAEMGQTQRSLPTLKFSKHNLESPGGVSQLTGSGTQI